MKFVGIVLLLFGLLLAGGCAFAAVSNLNFMKDPCGSCSDADRAIEKSHVAVKTYEAAKGTPGESAAKKDADVLLRAASISEKGCADLMQKYKMYGIVSVVAAVVGFLLLISGIFMLIRSSRKKPAATA